jgi:hypothetical protein
MRGKNGVRSALVALWSLLVLISFPTFSYAQRPTHEGKVLLFGNLHAHSQLSADVQSSDDEMLPSKAFKYAHENGLDFLAISDHHKADDSPGQPFRITSSDFTTRLFDAAMGYNSQHADKFIAIPGIEWGNTATGNHINVLGIQSLPPDTIKDKDYDKLIDWATSNARFIQFNHPEAWNREAKRNKKVGNFGRVLYGSDAAFLAAADGTVKTISIISTVKGGHISGDHKHSTAKTHRDVDPANFKHYIRFLNLGFRLSPAANQDTHWKNWGTVTAARTAVWADSASYEDLMNAFKANRVYATEDDEMVVALQAEYKGRRYWMGETVTLESEEDDVDLIVRIWQGQGSDGDSTDEGPYTVRIFSDADGIGGHEASVWKTHTGLQANVEARIPLHVTSGQYIFIEITEENGKDNPVGDGEDTINNTTGQQGPDGKRDVLNDSAWTTPIWFTSTQQTGPAFIWSKNSTVYHDPLCWVVPSIGSANRREGNSPPAGKNKHNCAPAK